jgi:hypothetical protein
MVTSFCLGYGVLHGYYFGKLDKRLRTRFRRLVSEHAHSVNALVTGISALPSTGKAYAATRAMSRFFDNEDTTLPTLIEPAQDVIRNALAASSATVVLVVHDWCMFNFNTHTSKLDRYQRSHDADLGYELGSALVVDATDGRALGPMELRVRTADAILSTRVRPTNYPPGHVDELLEVMDESRRWGLKQTPIHVIDREADSVGHYRLWQARAHQFVVRADKERVVLHDGIERPLADVVARVSNQFEVVQAAKGQPLVVTIQQGTGVVKVAETAVVLHRPAKKRIGDKQIEVPGPPIPLRLVVTRVVDELSVVLAEWWLLTNVAVSVADAATIGRWYAWRWRIESYHKLLKRAANNAEEWQQESGLAFTKRLCVASMACLTVWHLQRDESPEAASLREVLVRLSGRTMKHKVQSTAPALLAGLEKLLALDNLSREYDLDQILALARQVLPQLFPIPQPEPAKKTKRYSKPPPPNTTS